MALWSRFVGSAGSTSIGVALGTTAVPALLPAAQFLENEAWKAHPDKPPDAVLLAEGVAQGQVDPASARDWANQTGISDTAFAALVSIANVGPQLASALTLLRRGEWSEADYRTALKRQGIEERWFDGLVTLQHERLSPEIVAVMLQRNVIPDQGQLPGVDLDTSGKVPRFPKVPIDAYAQAKAHGYSDNFLDALTRIQGLPPGMDLVARLVFRDVLDRGDFNLAAEQSNRRVEWADFEYEAYRQIPTAHEFVEGHLRGWIDQQAMYDGTAKHGMKKADTDLLYKVSGRPVTVHEIVLGLARGAIYPSTYGDVPEPFRKAIQESNIRPEWASIHYHARFAYPSAFVLRSLAQSGDLGGQTAIQQVLEEIGWKPSFAKQVSTAWATAATTADPYTTKAQNQLWTTSHRSFVASEIDAPTATDAMEAAGVSAATSPAVLALWTHERSLVRKQLTPPQVKKAYKDGLYTRQRAMDALLARGYEQGEAGTLLDE